MKKLNKLFLAAGSAAAVAAPIAAVVSCGASTDELAVNTGGYAGSFQKLANGDVTVAGAWGDARFYAGKDASNIEAVGIETARISNDGIQVRGDMKVGDSIALQAIFPALIAASKGEAALQIPVKKDGVTTNKSLFTIYSHDGYAPLHTTDKVNVMGQDGKVHEQSVKSDVADNATFADGDSDYFTASTDKDHSVGGYASKTNAKTLKITFIPSNDPAQVQEATKKLNTYLNDHGVKVNINVSSDYDVAATQLKEKQIDVAFLPVETWAQQAGDAKFIISAVRPTQVASLNFAGGTVAASTTTITDEKLAVELFNKYGQLSVDEVSKWVAAADAAAKTALEDKNANLKLFAANKALPQEALVISNITALEASKDAKAYEAWIYTKTGSDFDKEVKAKATVNNWKEDWATAKTNVIYGYTSTTSASSYVYPEIWFKDHFTGFTSFQD